ncbi:MAG TPA: alpha-L-fucosidase [Chthonomonadales bacterium]|nr:alpha-L-fucosidase [Chthonomonadales bacterium]
MSDIDRIIESGPFSASWESLQQARIPTWYMDGKFGIFIHWGAYSVPAFGSEWYPRNMYQKDSPEYRHHLEVYGDHRQFGYKDFIPQFRAEHFDPHGWASLFRASGARFVVPVAEHHDGFAMYHSELSEWCAARMGPGRDLLGELAAAIRRESMVFGASSHRAEHWWFFDGGTTFPSDVNDPEWAGLYGPARSQKEVPDAHYLDDWLARTCEIVDRYRPQLLWFDWWIEEAAFAPYLRKFAAYYYNRAAEWGVGVAINYKKQAFPPGAAVWDIERGQLGEIREPFWQTDTSISKNSWGYVKEQDYKTAEEIIGDLVDIVSKNGALLLNIGPRPDGTIPEAEQQVLRSIGQWLSANGAAIYGSRPCSVYGEGPTSVVAGEFNDTKRTPFTYRDIRFTCNGSSVFAIPLARPEGSLRITEMRAGSSSFAGDIQKITLLDGEQELTWKQQSDGLIIDLPAEAMAGFASAIRIDGLLPARRS